MSFLTAKDMGKETKWRARGGEEENERKERRTYNDMLPSSLV
jgi:hypothetical protein